MSFTPVLVYIYSTHETITHVVPLLCLANNTSTSTIINVCLCVCLHSMEHRHAVNYVGTNDVPFYVRIPFTMAGNSYIQRIHKTLNLNQSV